MVPIQDEQMIDELKQKLKLWHFFSIFWEVIYWLVGTATVALAARAAVGDMGIKGSGQLFAMWAAIATGFLGFAKPEHQSERYIRAYRILDPSLRAFQKGLLEAATLIEHHRQAERQLERTNQIPPAPSPPVPEKDKPNDVLPGQPQLTP